MQIGPTPSGLNVICVRAGIGFGKPYVLWSDVINAVYRVGKLWLYIQIVTFTAIVPLLQRMTAMGKLASEVLETAPLLNKGLGKLPEHTVHVGGVTGPQSFKEADVAPVRGDQEG